MRRLLVSLLVLPFVFAQGCGGSDGPSASDAWVGGYALLSVDGDPVPSTIIQAPSYLLEITQGTGSVNGDGTYTLSLTVRENDHGSISTQVLTSIGTYTRSGSAFVFTDARDGSHVTGVFASNRFTLTDDDGFVYIFQKS